MSSINSSRTRREVRPGHAEPGEVAIDQLVGVRGGHIV
jgi:hypothetical protein